MDNELIVCPECSTENEMQYEFCKNCGAPLKLEKSEPKAEPHPAPNAYSGYNPNYQAGNFILEEIDGNSTADVSMFIGKNAYKFIPKFSKMQVSGSKVSWCWPAAVLGFLFGPLGTALWFLYRKMYKIGIILIAIGFSLGILNAAFFGTEIPFAETFNAIIEGAETGNVDTAFLDDYGQEAIYSSIDSILSYAAALFGGLFAMYYYKEYVKQKIDAHKVSGIDKQYYHLGLATVGGTSGGALALGIIALVLLNDAVAIIPSFL